MGDSALARDGALDSKDQSANPLIIALQDRMVSASIIFACRFRMLVVSRPLDSICLSFRARLTPFACRFATASSSPGAKRQAYGNGKPRMSLLLFFCRPLPFF